jgi:asparagine synthase (glutamine-hydrolysing)
MAQLSSPAPNSTKPLIHRFHDPKTVNAATFPWLAAATTASHFDGTQVLDADLLERLNLPEFQADSYAQAIAETPVQKGEHAVERRMRQISYLHLTRFVRFLLDRKDRMSYASTPSLSEP